MAPVLWIGGSSHALAFFKAFKAIKNMGFELRCFAQAGATYEQIEKLFPPVENFKEGMCSYFLCLAMTCSKKVHIRLKGLELRRLFISRTFGHRLKII
jgi:hypothetical protein